MGLLTTLPLRTPQGRKDLRNKGLPNLEYRQDCIRSCFQKGSIITAARTKHYKRVWYEMRHRSCSEDIFEIGMPFGKNESCRTYNFEEARKVKPELQVMTKRMLSMFRLADIPFVEPSQTVNSNLSTLAEEVFCWTKAEIQFRSLHLDYRFDSISRCDRLSATRKHYPLAVTLLRFDRELSRQNRAADIKTPNSTIRQPRHGIRQRCAESTLKLRIRYLFNQSPGKAKARRCNGRAEWRIQKYRTLRSIKAGLTSSRPRFD